ncbi:MAG: AraC family transcriptional regulator [Planctomycetota bacterium]
MTSFHLADRPAFIPAISLGVEHFPRYINRRVELNSHDVVEMTLIVAGKGTYHLNDVRFPVGPGSLCVVHFGEAHCLITDDDGIELYNLYVDPRRMSFPPLDGPLREALTRFLPMHPALAHRANRVAHLTFRDANIPSRHVRTMASEMSARAPGWQQALAQLNHYFLIVCARQVLNQGGSSRPVSRSSQLPSQLSTVCAHIDYHLQERLSLPGLADVAGISSAHLTRLFRSHTGLSVIGYVRQRRLERAMGLLASTNTSVSAIALDCGFGDLSHFHHLFQRAVRCTPAAYRRRMGG